MIFTLEELAQFLGGEPSERPGPHISGVRPIEYAGANDITYVAGPRFLEQLVKSGAGAVIIGPDLWRIVLQFRHRRVFQQFRYDISSH